MRGRADVVLVDFVDEIGTVSRDGSIAGIEHDFVFKRGAITEAALSELPHQ